MDKSDHCHVEPAVKQASPEERSHIVDAWLLVWGMGCPNCEARVRNSLLARSGVVRAEVNHLNGSAHVFYNPKMVTEAALTGAVAQAGGDGRHEYRAVFANLAGPGSGGA
ncbi:MAG TPA: cation transporter [Anaerolineales bacterium]|nr:cation transporter [Anaerolineales bacterium]